MERESMSDLLEKTNSWGTHGYRTKGGRMLRIGMKVRVHWPDGTVETYKTEHGWTMTDDVWDHGNHYPPSQQAIPVIEIEHHGAIVPLMLDGLEAYLVEETEKKDGEVSGTGDGWGGGVFVP